jgi:hypothetical protein
MPTPGGRAHAPTGGMAGTHEKRKTNFLFFFNDFCR